MLLVLMSDGIFREEQRFRQPWMWALLIFCSGLVLVSAYTQLFHKASPGAQQLPAVVLYIMVPLIGLGLPALFFIMRLETSISNQDIRYRFYPLQFKERVIPLEQIADLQLRQYRPIVEYGGWGIRYGGAKIGWAFNISGNKGLQLALKDGRRILLGTARPADMQAAVEKVTR